MPRDAAGVTPLRERLGALRNVPPFLAMVWRTGPWLTGWALVLRLVRAGLPVLTLYVGKLIIDEVVALSQVAQRPATAAAWIDSGLLDGLAGLVGLELLLAVASDVLGRVVSMLESLLSERFTDETSVRLMEHAATLDLEDLEDSEMQDRLERARRQASGRTALLGQLLGQGQDALTIALFGAGLVAYAPGLIVLLVAALVPAFLGEAHFNAQGWALAHRRTPERRELDTLRQAGTSVVSAKEVKIFALERFLVERYRALADDFYRANRALAMRRAGWGGLLAALGTAAYYAAYAWLIARTVGGAFTIGDLTFLAASFRRLRGLLEGLLSGLSGVAGQALYLDDLFSFFDIRPEIVSPPDARPFPSPILEGFRFENVGFTYPGSTSWALRGLSFELRAGEVLALVGENGAGKTTVVKLLARLYDPDEGRVLLDGHDLREHDVADLRRRMGVIFQDFVRYQMTAAENVAVGRIESRLDRPRIEAAARAAGADEVVGRLARGYDQMIGRGFRGGVDLSGGEWQKLAIARAYMRDAQVLILDEPTAALDARSEAAVFRRFKELSRGRTAVLISHRFSSVRMADRILVLADGRAEAIGTHEELLAQGGRYAELFELQAEGYK